MKLPVEISPNPLVTTAVELRFSSNLDSSQVLSLVMPEFIKDLPNFREGVPKALRVGNEMLKYAADYMLQNVDYSFGFSNNSLVIEILSEYKFWRSYFLFINDIVNRFFSLKIINKIERIGVRYGSIFNGTTSIEDVIRFKPEMSIDGFDQQFVYMRAELTKDKKNIHVQISNNAKAQKGNKSLSGVYVDIDSSLSENLSPDSSVFAIIDDLHLTGKLLFFDQILKPSFLETLNPKY